MRRRVVAGNWKMHGSSERIRTLATSLVDMVSCESVDVIVSPPFPYLQLVRRITSGAGIGLAGQDCSQYPEGAHTGEVAADMLADVCCEWVILGHSERRQAGESDADVAAKATAARGAGLKPILCVGETLAQREAGNAREVVTAQLEALVDGLAEGDMIAYEPVWAIGTGETATPAQAQEMHAAIRAFLAQRKPVLADMARLLYGGSVKADNAAELFAQDDIDGGLVGGASLKADEFSAIVKAAQD
jgi:triosephosphate isomerase